MSKRHRHEISTEEPPLKRARQVDRLSPLSDELLLHVLGFLPIPSLITCQRVSRRLMILAGDSELWKRKYYSRWVWPRARRIRQTKQSGVQKDLVGYSPRVSKWLYHSPLTKVDENMNWKGQYRLQHNWSKGSCRVTEVEVAQHALSTVVVKLDHGVVFTADMENGLRAWSLKDTNHCLAAISLSQQGTNESRDLGAPTAITVTPDEQNQKNVDVTVGFKLGSIAIYSFTYIDGQPNLIHRLSHTNSADVAITALASHKDYLLVLSENKDLSLYQIYTESDTTTNDNALPPPRLIATLTANSIQPPFSLSVRTTPTHAIASIAYTFPRLGCGWSVGIQELRWCKLSGDLGSRLATTVDSQFLNVSWPVGPGHLGLDHRSIPTFQSRRNPYMFGPSLSYTQPPTSLSYSHPYLLASHADNTLTMYLVVSTADNLAIRMGHRLWGHTSSVSGVQVSARGKAVSVSTKGDEIRVWELEDVISSRPTSRTAVPRDRSVQLSPESSKTRSATVPAGIIPNAKAVEKQIASVNSIMALPCELSLMKGSVEFDDQQVVVLREQKVGRQLLGCYDFT